MNIRDRLELWLATEGSAYVGLALLIVILLLVKTMS